MIAVTSVWLLAVSWLTALHVVKKLRCLGLADSGASATPRPRLIITGDAKPFCFAKVKTKRY